MRVEKRPGRTCVMFKPLVIILTAVTAAVGAAGAVLALDRAMPAPAVLPRADDGHFWALGRTEAGMVRFLVDTGATRVTLTRADADRLGLTIDPGAFTERVHTPAGPARAAPVRLDWLAVGPVRVEAVEALVFEEGAGVSLLGMSYLGRLERLSVDGEAMSLSG